MHELMYRNNDITVSNISILLAELRVCARPMDEF